MQLKATPSQDDILPDLDLTVKVNLKELGLRHDAGSGCDCRGLAHEMIIIINPDDHQLHRGEECIAADPAVAEKAVQALHEQAHPDGVLYAENCREHGCKELGIAS